jgi:hypothetical protein
MINSMVCRCGKETSRVNYIDTNGRDLSDSRIMGEIYWTLAESSSAEKEEREEI